QAEPDGFAPPSMAAGNAPDGLAPSPPPAGDTPDAFAPPPPPAGLTRDEDDALQELERTALPPDGRVSGVVVLCGSASGAAAVAAEFVERHRAAFREVAWYRRPFSGPWPRLNLDDIRQVLLVMDIGVWDFGVPGSLDAFDWWVDGTLELESAIESFGEAAGRGALVLALGDTAAGRGYPEIHIGGRSADPVPPSRPLGVAPRAPGPRPPRPGDPPARPPSVRPSGNTPREILGDLVRMLPWLAEGVPFDLLEALWPAGPLNAALGMIHETGGIGISWARREVWLLPDQRTAQGDPHGRALAEWMLLSAYGEERSLSPLRHIPGEDVLAPQVVALSWAVPPRKDGEFAARLYCRAGRYLMQVREGRTGVRLCERALAYVEARPSARLSGPLMPASRPELTELALDAGLHVFMCLSEETLRASELVDSASLPGLMDVQLDLQAAYTLSGGDPRTTLPFFQRALAWSTATLGRQHRLTEQIRAAVNGLDSPGT
ncbi:MAG: hypothetical protein HOY69_01185, partial [Streptomyces sp.]|nr:hypothetical protein [Streptomyces sp.]